MFSHIEEVLIETATILPLEAFVFFGSIIEEIIAPIPSPTIMVAAGSLALLEGRSAMGLLPLALIGALGKTIGALLVYYIVDKMEDVVMQKFGHFFSITHEDVEKLGSKLGNGARDYFMLTFLRAFPIVPSVVISVGAGLLKISLPLFIISTFLGTIIRDGLYLYAGFVGTEIFKSFIASTAYIEAYIQIIIGIMIIFGTCFIVRKKWKK